MAKRFIDTNLFRKTFIRSLSAPHKLLWIYLFCDCSHAGIWEIDYELASLFVGSKIKKTDIETFGNKIIFIDDNKIFIPEFIEFQYGELKQNNNAHNSVIRDLKKYSLLDDNLKYNFEGLMRGLTAPMDMDKDKDMEMDKDKEKPKNCLMRNSLCFDFNYLISNIGSEYQKYDLDFYHKSLLNWSDSKNAMKVDWVATIRNAILRDQKENKAKLNIQSNQKPFLSR
jgi:hypothetical protein